MLTVYTPALAVGDRVRWQHRNTEDTGVIVRVGLYSHHVRLDSAPDFMSVIPESQLQPIAPELPLEPTHYAPCQPVMIFGAARDFVGVVEAYEPEREYPYFVWLYQPIGGKWHGFWYGAEQLTPFVLGVADVTVAEVDALQRRVAAMAARLETQNTAEAVS